MTAAASRPASLGAAHTDINEFGAEATERVLLERRARHIGIGLLFYHDPIHLVRGDGVWMFDADGRRYLDCYNNVPSVGHSNPKIVAAMAEQAAILNTHDRYLHETVVDYAEELTATLPDGLDRCIFVNSGTEANDLAMRLARAATGNNGAVVMENGYHGNSTLIAELSMMGVRPSSRASYVAPVEPPDVHAGPFAAGDDAGNRYAALVDEAIAELDERGEGVAAFMCDGIFDSQGGLEAPSGYFADVYGRIRAAGGLCLADEVQPGFARTGQMWGFSHDDVVPDIVTFGKPAGNGFPLAGLITTAEIMDAFSASNVYFNTFGGNPVSAAVGLAVLREIDGLDLCRHSRATGAYLRGVLEDLQSRHAVIGNIRGRGLYQGIALVDPATGDPNPALARLTPDAMKDEGVLMGMTGRRGNVLKVRPPLVFDNANADQLVDTLDKVLTDLT